MQEHSAHSPSEVYLSFPFALRLARGRDHRIFTVNTGLYVLTYPVIATSEFVVAVRTNFALVNQDINMSSSRRNLRLNSF